MDGLDPMERLSAALSGQYRLERELGSGGMARVYLAEDLKHHRQVAIKVLREELAASLGADRFLREIAIAARLQHPHILPLLDSGEADGALYYVMPFVPGQSLRERIAREGALPVTEALRILVEVTDALAHAHAQGVVHRDIKPDNVMLSGRHALVADFGIAKAVSAATGDGRVTTHGMALGTPAYMSPEQAAADPHVDHRGDIYAVGVMAYELLGGRLPFMGGTPQQILAAHVTETPDPLSRWRRELPAGLEAVVMRCLAKRPADRWQSADELLALLEPLRTPGHGTAAPSSGPTGVSRRRLALMVVPLIGLAAALVWELRPGRSAPLLIPGRGTQVTFDPMLEIHPTISPDGRMVAFAAGNARRMRIFTKAVGGDRTIPLSDDSTMVLQSNPRWSPGGTQILFLADSGVSVAPVLSRSSRVIVPGGAGAIVRSAAWSPTENEIAIIRNDSLLVVGLDGRVVRAVTTGKELHSCSWSPDGRWIACVSGNGEATRPGITFGNLAPSRIVLAPAAGGAFHDFTSQEGMHQSPVWMPDSRALLFISNRDTPRDVYVQAVGRDGEAVGEPRRVTNGLGVETIAISHDASLMAYANDEASSNIWALAIPSTGMAPVASATQVTAGSQIVEAMRVSDDGRWLLYDSGLHGNVDIYRMPIGGGAAERLTFDPRDEFAPSLSPDGKRLAYHTHQAGVRKIEIRALDGGAVDTTGIAGSFPVWSHDGKMLVAQCGRDAPVGACIIRPGATGQWVASGTRGPDAVRPEWSPDDRWLIYQRNGVILRVGRDGGAPQVVYQPRPGDPVPEMVAWKRDDARTLLFKSHDSPGHAAFWSIPVGGGRPQRLAFFADLDRPSNRRDFSNDGRRLFFTIEDRRSDVWVVELRKQ